MIIYNKNIKKSHRMTLENFLFHKIKSKGYEYDSFISKNTISFMKNGGAIELKVNNNVFYYEYKKILEEYKMIPQPY